jgi:hypothetical protein
MQLKGKSNARGRNWFFGSKRHIKTDTPFFVPKNRFLHFLTKNYRRRVDQQVYTVPVRAFSCDANLNYFLFFSRNFQNGVKNTRYLKLFTDLFTAGKVWTAAVKEPRISSLLRRLRFQVRLSQVQCFFCFSTTLMQAVLVAHAHDSSRRGRYSNGWLASLHLQMGFRNFYHRAPFSPPVRAYFPHHLSLMTILYLC